MLLMVKGPLTFGFFASVMFLILSVAQTVKCLALRTTNRIDQGNFDFEYTLNKSHRPANIASTSTLHSEKDNNTTGENGAMIYVCSLHLVADHLFFKNIGHGDVNQTTNAMFHLVNETNRIFRMNFKDQTIKFIPENMTIIRNERQQGYLVANTPMTIDEFLLEESLFDFRNVCLGIVFTFRDFGNIIGATYRKKFGSELRNSGELEGAYYFNYNSVNYHRVSVNTIVISFLVDQKRVKRNQQLLALVHELGHNLGGTHDNTFKGVLGQDKGHFIMDPDLFLEDQVDYTYFRFSKSNLNNILSQLQTWQTCPDFKNGPGSANCLHYNECEQVCCRLPTPNEPNVYVDKTSLSRIAAHLKRENMVSYLSFASVYESLHLEEPSTYLPILFSFLFLLFLIFIICSLKGNYKANDTNEMRVLRHSKMLRAVSMGEYMTKNYRERIVTVNKIYCKKIQDVNQHMYLDYVEAIARLKTLFPHVPVPYLQRIVKISANESAAVKILLTHGYPMTTFYESLMALKKLMKTVTIRYKK